MSGCLDMEPTPPPIPPPAPLPTVTATVTPTPSATPSPTETPRPPATPTPSGPVRTPVAGDAGAAFTAMLTAMEKSASYRYNMVTLIGPAEQQTRLEVAGQYQAPDRYQYTLRNGLEPPLEVIAIGPAVYQRTAGAAWAAGPLEPSSSPLGATIAPTALVGLLTYAREAHAVGQEQIGDGPPAARLAYTLAPVGGPLVAQGGDVWLRPDGRLARLLLRFGGAGAAGTITLDFSDYDAPLAINAPEP